ncbi:MAG: hypothetical protein LBG95_00445 [Treponema sp.]|jgi:hypothetical protein|nr:hypothetical protein [Treponema sp.]
MKTGHSEFMLERYKLGELGPEDQRAVTEALARDDGLRSRLEQLDESDWALRLSYPTDFFGLKKRERRRAVRAGTVARFAGLAALIAAGVILPALYFFAPSKSESNINNGIAVAAVPRDLQSDRGKGRTQEGSELLPVELSLYLKGRELKGEAEIVLPNQSVLEEGNTVQLAYTVPAGAERYGVIFSVDGRSAVTMHYPYRKGQSSLLVSGKRTFLHEAYILDDAPDYEIFVMVVSEKPLDVDAILEEAQTLIEEKNSVIFDDCEMETITILKK